MLCLTLATPLLTGRKIYEFLAERAQKNIPPSVREIGQAVGLKSTSSVQSNLDALEAAGYIERDPMLKRTIRVKNEADDVIQVPLIGTVTAGMPILAVESIEGYVPCEETLISIFPNGKLRKSPITEPITESPAYFTR